MKNLKSKIGITLITLITILTAVIWFIVRIGTPKFSNYATATHSLGQLTGLLGMTLFALSFVLTTRLKFVEEMFGGLDKVYMTHHLIGAISFILLLFHPLLLVFKFIPSNFPLAATYLLPSSSWPVNFGIIALLSMTILIILTLYINMKYQNWKLSHKLMGVVFVIACLHVFLITTDISIYPMLKYYMILIAFIGFVSHSHGSYFNKILNNDYTYVVESVEVKDKITVISLKPKDKIMNYKPGQFIFIRYLDKNISKEKHPFTIAAAPNSGKIRLAVKSLGDYTNVIKNISVGSIAEIEGPYGRFMFEDGNNDQIWIAGGIGITPFISFAESLEKSNQKNKIELYYCVKNKSEAVFLDHLEKISNKHSRLKIIPYYSDESGYLNIEKIIKLSSDIKNKDIFLCGPPTLVQSLIKQFKKAGIELDNIHLEDFNFK